VICTIIIITSSVVLYYEYRQVYRHSYGYRITQSSSHSYSYAYHISEQASAEISWQVTVQRMIMISASLVVTSVLLIVRQVIMIVLRFLDITTVNSTITVILTVVSGWTRSLEF